MFLSIIIPTWRNTETELIRCMDSIYQSSWRDFEVLLVDDGNEAAYGVMLDKLAACYPITVIHAPHGGASAARNLAVKEAQGDYVLFVDADDVVTQQFWRDAEKVREQELSFDIIYGLMAIKDEGKPFPTKVYKDFDLKPLDEKERRTLYRYMYTPVKNSYATEEGSLCPGPCARFVRRNFLQKFPFDTELTLGEDVIWNLDMLKDDPQVCVLRHVWYYVIGNPDSINRGYRENIVEQYRTWLQTLKRYIPKEDEDVYLLLTVFALKQTADQYYLAEKNPLSWQQKVESFNHMAKSDPFNELLKNDVKMGG